MIVAVTGSKGFVGRNLVKSLKALGHQVIEIDLETGIDITETDKCNSIPSFEIMYHLAARIFVPDAYRIPTQFYKTNYIGTLNMLELCRKNNARFVFSSSYVYGNPQYLPIDENHPLSAFNPYADSKIMGEMLCKSYNEFFGVKSVIVRPFNLYGKDQHDDLLISSIIKQAQTGKISLKSSAPKRDYIYIDDIVAAYIRLLDFNAPSVEAFNIGSGISYSVREITEMINRLFDNQLEINFSEESRANEVMNTVANIDKAKKLLGWQPTVSFQEGIKMCF